MRIYRTLQRLEDIIGPFEESQEMLQGAFLTNYSTVEVNVTFIKDFIRVMDDDLNTAGAVGLVFEKVRDLNKELDSNGGAVDHAKQVLLTNGRYHLLLACRVLGLLQDTPAEFFKELSAPGTNIDAAEIEERIKERTSAKEQKDWARADEIRDYLKEMGVVLEDGPQGTTWRLDV